MSTQRRDCPWWLQPRMDGAGALWQICLAPLALIAHACASGGTAPPDFSAWLATNSLHSDCRPNTFVRHVPRDFRRGSPPIRACQTAASGTSGIFAPSLLPFPSPARLERFHPVLP
jgi:hypothetical protein